MRFRLPFSVLRHAVVMVGRTIKSYMLLSVTIVLSFSLLLGYLLYTDSSLYNRYKELFHKHREEVVVHELSDNSERMSLFCQNVGELENTFYYIAYSGRGGQLTAQFCLDGVNGGESFGLSNWQLIFLPDYCWLTTMFLPSDEIVWTDGSERDGFFLEANECLLNEGIYYALGLDQTEDPVYKFRFQSGLRLDLEVVGYIRDDVPLQFDTETGRTVGNYAHFLLMSTKVMELAKSMYPEAVSEIFGVVFSDDPEQVAFLADLMDYTSIWSVYQQHNDALETIRNEKSNKAIIACALLLLLGINLYSSFTNALNDRKFEIGVKRAVGASSWSIVRQFLYESCIVMVANTVISIAVVADVFIIYKYIYERIPDAYGNYNVWTIYISPHSIAMFGLCAVTLTVVFSLIFAYKSTRVEIVQYLKAE